MTILDAIFIYIAAFLVGGALRYGIAWLWPHVPLLPGLFEDMANGYSYDEKGNRIDD